MKHTNGAGVILVHMIAGEPHVILFRDCATGLYNDAGGRMDKGELSRSVCAERELTEESAGLFAIHDLKSMRSMVIVEAWPHYTAFLVPVKFDVEDVRALHKRYHLNKVILRKSGPQWNETNDLASFCLKDLLAACHGVTLRCEDTRGILRRIHKRVAGILSSLQPAQMRFKAWNQLHSSDFS